MAAEPLEPLSTGVRAIAWLFMLCGAYLAGIGFIMLLRPGTISMAAGAPLLFGLELAGPYMFLLMALVAGGIAFGLFRRVNLIRHIASIAAIAGVVMLVPSVSSAVAMVQFSPLAWGGLGVIVRVIIAWYLLREEIAREFGAG